RAVTGYLFLLPALALMGVFTFYPFVQGLTLSFQSWDGVGATSWVGLSNYQRVIGDNIFWVSLVNAGIFGAVGFVLGNILSLGMALAVNSLRRGSTFYRVAYYVPGVFSVVVVGMMFAWILQGSVGILNRALGAVGLEMLQRRWLTDPETALPSVALVYVWFHWGFGFLLFLAGLQGVPRELHEAASIDGAGAWGRFRYVTWPQLIPVTTIVSVLTLLGALQIFGTVQVLTNGGPGYLTEVPTLRIYKEGFQFHRFGVAAAMSVVFGSILVALSLVQIWLGRRSYGEGE
ncbi:MAG TPA: sugar ABC transporter permease, partial [Chloroflexota bacterium]|nr:sugar ABC transporter permease [Chloroflexota bacterium]